MELKGKKGISDPKQWPCYNFNPNKGPHFSGHLQTCKLPFKPAKMEKGENQLQVLGICNRLFNFVTNSFTFRSFKGGQVVHSVKPMKPIDEVQRISANEKIHVELKQANEGHNTSTHANALGELAHEEDNAIAGGRHEDQMQDTANVPSSNESKDKEGDKDGALLSDKAKPLENGFKLVPIPHVPKKSVSIKEGVEEINIPRKKRNAPKGKKQEAMESEKDSGMESPRPLKPILKVTSNYK